MKSFAFIFVYGLITLESVKAQDGGCTATGMKPYDYAQALCMSSLFYEAQRSGILPANQSVTWRGDSAVNDGSDNGVDLVGGYYDAGDTMKFGLPGAFTITALAWGLILYPNGYQTAGETEHAKNALRWGAEYLLKAATGTNTFWGQIGDPDIDHAHWGRPEDMTMPRPSYSLSISNPGSDIAGEAAAALAASSIVFSGSTNNADKLFSEKCLKAAKNLFDFADQYRDTYTNSIPNAAPFYPSYTYEDELAWSALWMYKATKDAHYLTKANNFIEQFGILYYAVEFNWDSKPPGIYALAAELDGRPEYIEALSKYVNKMMTEQQKTPKGLLYISEWGTLRDAMNTAFILMRAASLPITADPIAVRAFAQSQMDYALGSTGRSFVVGFGVNPPKRPHHKAASCPDPPKPCDFSNLHSPDPNPHVLYGALVGGPYKNDSYVDKREDYVQNEVAIDYNALFTGLLAALVELH